MYATILLIVAGIHSFILILGITGALAGGLEGTILLLTYLKAKKMRVCFPSKHLKLVNSVFDSIIRSNGLKHTDVEYLLSDEKVFLKTMI